MARDREDREKNRDNEAHLVGEVAPIISEGVAQDVAFTEEGEKPKVERGFNPPTTSRTNDAFDDDDREEKRKHVVKKGDTLSEIARNHDVSLSSLLEANPQIDNPDMIHPGDVIKIPQVGGNPKKKDKGKGKKGGGGDGPAPGGGGGGGGVVYGGGED